MENETQLIRSSRVVWFYKYDRFEYHLNNTLHLISAFANCDMNVR